MIFSVIVLVLVGAIAYFHYVQGFFSATLSAMLAIISAVLAVSFHETVVFSLLQGKVADQAHALVLVALFVVIYGLLRVVFDKAIPGSIRLPVLADKIGAAAAGFVAGVFCIGIFAIAAQTLPFGPSIAGYARYTLVDQQEVRVPSARQQVDSYVYNALKNAPIDPADRSSLIIPVDNMVVGLTRKLSDGGSLAGPQSFSAVHPNYLDELFFQRLGVQTGAKHVAYNLKADQQVEVKGIYSLESIPQADGEGAYIPGRWSKGLTSTIGSKDGNLILIVRLGLSRNASDSDNNVRISTGAVRLVANATNYLPIGTLEDGPVVRAHRPDDFIIVKGDGVVDFVFLVPAEKRRGVIAEVINKTDPLKMAPNVFIEAKRMGYVDLSEREIKREVPPAEGKDSVFRKKDLPAPKAAPGSGSTAAKELSDGPIEFDRLFVSDQLFSRVNVGGRDGDNSPVTFTSGKGQLKDKKLAHVEVDAMESLTRLGAGDFSMSDLWAPPGSKIVQVYAYPNSKSPWVWADKIAQFELVGDKGGPFVPRGAFVKVKSGTTDMMIARWDAEKPLTDVPYKGDLRPTDVWIAFVVPENTTIREVRFNKQRIKSVDQIVN
jgi:hypothetical protein